jgi:DNA-directed RNA polymerase specialized sigma24 family protein
MGMSEEEVVREPVFATTRWSLVLNAARPDLPESDHALAELCRLYWYPLYAHVRRFGHDPHTAQDLTQEFFARLLEKNYLSTADRKRGKFRWFLLTAFKCFLANEWDRVCAQKRGGGNQPVWLDALTAEERYRFEPVDTLTADQLYDRRWALDLLARVQQGLSREYASADKAERFQLLEQFLPGAQPLDSYAAVGTRLGLNENAIKQEVHRMKKRYVALLRGEVAQTVAHPDEVDEELRHLIDVVSRG